MMNKKMPKKGAIKVPAVKNDILVRGVSDNGKTPKVSVKAPKQPAAPMTKPVKQISSTDQLRSLAKKKGYV